MEVIITTASLSITISNFVVTRCLRTRSDSIDEITALLHLWSEPPKPDVLETPEICTQKTTIINRQLDTNSHLLFLTLGWRNGNVKTHLRTLNERHKNHRLTYKILYYLFIIFIFTGMHLYLDRYTCMPTDEHPPLHSFPFAFMNPSFLISFTSIVVGL